MSLLIEQIAREAKATFSKEVAQPIFTDNFYKFVGFVGKLQASDVKLNESFEAAPGLFKRIFPCLYIRVLSTETFLISIYILLKSEVTVPLHDHVGKHVIIKVIQGSVRISAYTSMADEPGDKAAPQDVKDKVGETQEEYLILVHKHEPMIMGEKDQPCVLRPKDGDFHEIRAIDDMAVFLEVLAPPYVDTVDERSSTFYKALETAEQDDAIKTWLIKIPPDVKLFHITDIPYYGPKIKL